ncbi:MAG TPA: GNAT family N-acetyltransferase [Burkholderiales bacterium]|jgi:phosphinothricin acetyltransferase|nr:GNAT family N-acetyltransferase [Burkholderiales bacterium]
MGDSSIRLATRADAAAINDIQNYYVVGSTATFHTEPLTLDARLAWLENRTAAHPVTVAEGDGRIVGWGALEVFRSRPAYRHTTEFSVYIHHEWHRRGIGRAIMADLVTRARALQYHALVGGCCSESTAVIAMLEAMGFARVAHFREVGRKFDRWLDVVFLELVL